VTALRSFLVLLLLVLGPAAAFAQGTVSIYNWVDYFDSSQLKRFESKTGIKVEYATYESDQTLDAWLRSGTPRHDVVFPTASPYFARQVADGLYRPLDRRKLSPFADFDPAILTSLAREDPGNAHGLPWTWGTTGIGYDVDAALARSTKELFDSLRLVFDPSIVRKFANCGVEVIDDPLDIFPAALVYLGLDPDSKSTSDLEKAADAVRRIRPYIAKFNPTDYVGGLEKGTACLAFGYSGDIFHVRRSLQSTRTGRDVVYAIPREGALTWTSVAAIPANAPHPDNALRFLDFLMDPAVAAASSKVTGYASANRMALGQMPPSITRNPLIYPPLELRSKFYTITPASPEQTREINRLWAYAKGG